MHVDTRLLDNNSEIVGDLCIIGTGPSGMSIALEYLNSKHKVILLEGGGFEYEDKIQNLYKGKTRGQKYYPLKSSRLHYFGGTSQHWGGMCSPLDEIDFMKRDWVDNSGWPIKKSDLDIYYKRAHNYLDLGEYNYDVNYWKENSDGYESFKLDKNIVFNKMWQFSAPTRFGTKYRTTIETAKNIFLYTYANVVEIIASENLSNVQELVVKGHNGKKHIVKAKKFILACGAIQNARLLLASNNQIKNGIGNKNDLVGRYFMEHLERSSGELWLRKEQSMNLYLLSGQVPNPPRAELALTQNTQRKLKILNGTVSLFPLASSRHVLSSMEFWQNENPNVNLTNWGGEKTFFDNMKDKLEIYKEEHEKGMTNAFQLYVRMEQSPNPNSRISLDTEKDALGVPRSILNWEPGELEKKSIRSLLFILAEEFGKSSNGRIRLLDFLRDENDLTFPQFGGGWHHIGTTRMNNDSKKGVVDSNLKVHGMQNLYIAGSGCFPTSGAANPTLTIVALCIRLADHLKSIK